MIDYSFPSTEVGSRHRPPPRRDLTIVRDPAQISIGHSVDSVLLGDSSQQKLFHRRNLFVFLSHSTATWYEPTQAAHSSSG